MGKDETRGDIDSRFPYFLLIGRGCGPSVFRSLRGGLSSSSKAASSDPLSPPERLANPRRAPRLRDRQPSIGDRADGRDPPWRNDQAAQTFQAFPGAESFRDRSLRLRCKVSRVVSWRARGTRALDYRFSRCALRVLGRRGDGREAGRKREARWIVAEGKGGRNFGASLVHGARRAARTTTFP